MARSKPVVLVILDGWGVAPPGPGNAITLADTPNINSLGSAYIKTQLIAHGESVGLPKREPGNTETGHLNIGAGNIIYQDLPRINMSIADGSFFANPALMAAAEHIRKHNSNLHLIGLVGGGGVHSDLSHFFALLRFCREQNITNVYLHVFTDGRDSPPTASITYINELESAAGREGVGKIATVMGRYYAMDRDFRWERTKTAYDCLTQSVGRKAATIQQAVSDSYSRNQTDEFIEPTIIGDNAVKISDNDAVVFVNFRIDRPRQLTKAFVLPDFENRGNTNDFDPYAIEFSKKHSQADDHRTKPFTRTVVPKNLYFVTMTEYEKNLPVAIAFPPQFVENPLGRVIADHGLRQLRMSESEKERFVTYYFNGLREEPFTGEDRTIIPSPKVPTYDKKPEMSAREITAKLIEQIKNNTYDFIVVNYANADMVGHTGNLKACIAACTILDKCIGELANVVINAGGVIFITADHGNAEEMLNLTTNLPDTEHNANPVPAIIAGNDFRTATQVPQGILADVAPTLLHILDVPLPISMSGRNLLGAYR